MTAAGPPSGPSPRTRLRDYTATSHNPELKKLETPYRLAQPTLRGSAAPIEREGRRFSAAIVVVLVSATSALAFYDLYLFVTMIAR
jgi:hypothetical protein